MPYTFVPQTQVIALAGVNLKNTYQDTIDFTTVLAQTAYFLNKEKHRFFETLADGTRGFTYQRDRQAIRVPIEYEEILDCDYVMYKNLNYSNKWFYAFITDTIYVNPNMTELIIELDVLQTFMFDYTWKYSFIERETVANDNPYVHTIPEPMETGPIIVQHKDFFDLQPMYIAIASAPSNADESLGELMEGVYSGVNYQFYPATDRDVARVNAKILSYSQQGLLDYIVGIYMIPKRFVDKFSALDAPIKKLVNITDTSLNGYTPKNNKLLCYPYRYFAVNNCLGQEINYMYELFSNPNSFYFNLSYTKDINAVCDFHPMDYNGQTENFDEGVTLGNFPICTWNGDVFANWVGQNRTSFITSLLIGPGDGGSIWGQGQSFAKSFEGENGGGTNSVMSGIGLGLSIAQKVQSNILNIAGIFDKKRYSYQLRNQSSSSGANIKWGRVGFELLQYAIKPEYAKIIDDYFSRFGYKVNRLGVPNLRSRVAWNYIKTIGAEITGDFPVMFQNKIISIFDNGITIWHGDWVGDYSRNNPIGNPPPLPEYPDPTNPPDPVDPPAPEEPPNPEDWGDPLPDWLSHITSPYGYRINPITGQSQFHAGVDIGYAAGTRIQAICGGVVSAVSENEARGKFLRVQSSARFAYLYQHCNEILVNVGDQVTLGEDIATVGATGQVTGPHLHMEIYDNNSTVNPVTFLEGVG